MKKDYRNLWIMVLSVLLFVSTGWAGDHEKKMNSDDLKAHLEEALTNLSKAVTAGDADAIATFYTDDVKIMAPNAETTVGNDAIAAILAEQKPDADFTVDEVEMAGKWAWQTGKYTFKTPEGTQIDQGKYLAIWKKTDDGWLIHRDAFNSNIPLGQ